MKFRSWCGFCFPELNPEDMFLRGEWGASEMLHLTKSLLLKHEDLNSDPSTTRKPERGGDGQIP